MTFFSLKRPGIGVPDERGGVLPLVLLLRLAVGQLQGVPAHHLHVVAVGPGRGVEVAHVVVAGVLQPGADHLGPPPRGRSAGSRRESSTPRHSPPSARRRCGGRAGRWDGRGPPAPSPGRRAGPPCRRSGRWWWRRRSPRGCGAACRRSSIRTSSGLPARGMRTLPGNRVEPVRAWTTTRTFKGQLRDGDGRGRAF